MRPLLRAITFALSLAACAPAVAGGGGPGPDAGPEAGTCAAVEGMGCACGSAAGAWRCVGEMPVCVCPIAPDVSAPDVDVDAVADAPAVDPRACFGPCDSHADCERSCNAFGGGGSYCCVASRCVASRVACGSIAPAADLCGAGAWGPVCETTAACGALCGAAWACVDRAGEVRRCELRGDAATADVADAATPDVLVDAPSVDRPASSELTARVMLIAPDRFDVTMSQCSASGWGTAAGPAATFRFDLLDRPPRDGTTWVAGTVTPGPIGSVAIPEERVTAGVVTRFGEPHATASGERVDFETRAVFRSVGTVVVTVTGCPVVP